LAGSVDVHDCNANSDLLDKSDDESLHDSKEEMDSLLSDDAISQTIVINIGLCE
jgi:hypothetical protein